MGSWELISVVAKRLTAQRRLNLAIIACLPILGILLLRYLAAHSIVPNFVFYSVTTALIAASGYLFYRRRQLFQSASAPEAAALLDRSLGTKERFLTIASVATDATLSRSKVSASALAAIEEQVKVSAPRFIPERELPFKLLKPAKVSAWVSPLLLLTLVALFLFGPSDATQAKSALSSARAERLRELIEQNKYLSPDLQDQLQTLAEALEENGLQSADTEEALELAMNEVQEELQDYREVSADEVLMQKEEKRPEPEKPEQQKNSPDEKKEKDSANSEQSEEQSAGEESEESGSQSSDASDGSKSEQQKGEQGKEGSSDGKGENEQQAGEKGEGEGSEQKQSGEGGKNQQGESEGGDNADAANKQDDKKGTTGTGEGKGGADGKAGGLENQKSETQAGKNAAGANEGDAQHNSPSKADPNSKESSSEQKDGSGEKDESGEKGKEGDSEQGESGAGKEQQLQKVEKELSDIKKEMQGEDSGEKQGAGKKGSGAPQDAQQEDKGEAGEGGEGEKKAEKSDSPETQKKQGQPSPNSSQGSDDSEQSQQNSSLNKKSQKPNAVPKENDSAPRFGPFEGGEEESLRGGDIKKERVEVPEQDKLVIHGLGSEEEQLYRNKPGAKSQTSLGSAEFKKPVATEAQSKQPIPVEYNDLLH